MYVEHLWEEGAPKSSANYVVAAIQFYRPESKHHLAWLWKLVKVWNQLEVPQRATPMTPELLMAFAGQAFCWQQFELGWLLVSCCKLKPRIWLFGARRECYIYFHQKEEKGFFCRLSE